MNKATIATINYTIKQLEELTKRETSSKEEEKATLERAEELAKNLRGWLWCEVNLYFEEERR